MVVCQKFIQYPPEVLWLNVSPRFKALSFPLLQDLDGKCNIASWEYAQDRDEPNSIDVAVDMLHHYLTQLPDPIHLVGHGTAGWVGLMYARQYPQHVKSLSLLSVGVHPALDWQAHYYTQLALLPCSRAHILRSMVKELFGPQQESACKILETVLEDDLKYSPSPHSLWNIWHAKQGGCEVPMFVSGSQNDTILTIDSVRAWESYLKPTDRIWECPKGRYFFHRFNPELTANALIHFWQDLEEDGDRSHLELCLAKDY